MAIEGLNPYVDIKTRTLYNKLGITSPEKLQVAESDFARSRLAELQEKPIDGAFDFDHLKEIHRHIFQDTYQWAGEIRQNFDAAKQEVIGGPAHAFTPSASIEAEGAKVFGRLAQDKALTNLLRELFIQKAARLHHDINSLHAFPEGNGRTQREFLRELSVQAGHPMDLRVATEERVIEASIAGQKGDHGPMQRLMTEAIDPERARSLRAAIDHLEKHLGTEKVSGLYVAATTPNEHYAGTLVDRAGKDFMFQLPNHHILIGHTADISAAARPRDAIEFTATDGKGIQVEQQAASDSNIELLRKALPDHAGAFDFRHQHADGVKTFEHKETHGLLHLDQNGRTLDKHGAGNTPEKALEAALSPQSERSQGAVKSNDPGPGFGM